MAMSAASPRQFQGHLMQIEVLAKAADAAAVSVAFVTESKKLAGPAAQFLGGASASIAQALAAPGVTGKCGQVLDLLSPAGYRGRRVLIVGLGDPRELTEPRAREIGGEIACHLMSVREERAQILAPVSTGRLDEPAFLASIALGARLRAYRFHKYVTQEKTDGSSANVSALHLVSRKKATTERALADAMALGDGICYARDLVNEPPSSLYPDSFAKRLLGLKKHGIAVEVIDEKALAKMGAGGILAVAQGSANPPRLVSLRWNGLSAKSKTPSVALVGKGVCFDSGGLCLKRPNQMFTMKGDMGGAAAVAGAILSTALRKAKVDVVGVMALVENMPSGTSYKPGDIVKTLSGKTIEILDTDAEGRITLVDSLYYAASKFNPDCVLDMATLTYSVMAALGPVYTGLFATQDALARAVTAAAEAAGEPVWRLPVTEKYLANLKSKIADYRHHATDEMGADAPHAAALLGEFVCGKPWAHLDIAGKEFAVKDKPTCPEGATGHGVATFDAFLRGRE